MTRPTARVGTTIGIVTAVLLWPAPAGAHPLGNFTTNTYAGLTVGPDEVAIDYVVDLAEIPALQTLQAMGVPAAGTVAEPERQAYRARECGRLAAGLRLAVDSAPVPVQVVGGGLTFPPGQAGLRTLRLECALRAPLATGRRHTITFVDRNFPDRIGWREISATGDGTTLAGSDVPATSVSRQLRAYPQDRLGSPLNVRHAELAVQPASAMGPRAAAEGGAAATLETARRGLTALMAVQRLTVPLGAAAMVVALALGALHALAPGHGKTLMGAYLVGRHGTSRQALGLGLTVAVTHTLGVLALGLAVSTAQLTAPERLYPWLGTASGLVFAAVGVLLLRQALASPATHDHAHSHGYPAAPAVASAGTTPRTLTWRSLAAPGLVGGLTPSPSALVVLLGGVALGRAWFGILLVIAYGAGMAVTLVGAGWLLLRAQGTLQRLGADRYRPVAWIATRLPLATAGLLIVGGLLVTMRSVAPG